MATFCSWATEMLQQKAKLSWKAVAQSLVSQQTCHTPAIYTAGPLTFPCMLADFRKEQSTLWAAFLELAQREAQALPYRDVMAAVDSLPSHGTDSN